MSDRIAVMDDGVVVQCGTPEEVYEQPAKPFVAGFIGISNLMDGVVEDGGVRLVSGALCAAPVPEDCTGRHRGPALRAAGEDLARRARAGHGPADGDGGGARLCGHDHAGDRRARAGDADRRARADAHVSPRQTAGKSATWYAVVAAGALPRSSLTNSADTGEDRREVDGEERRVGRHGDQSRDPEGDERDP